VTSDEGGSGVRSISENEGKRDMNDMDILQQSIIHGTD
jgi:hypothetical protein